MRKILLILVIALGLRLINLNQSLWLDEAISANSVKNNSYLSLITNFSTKDFHPPLYYWTLKLWTSMFGNSEISLRLPSIIFSIVTVWIVFLIAGGGAAWLTALNPLLIYYSQEARMYSMVTMWLIVGLYLVKEKKYGWLTGVIILSLATFYGAIFFIAALGIYFLVKKQIKGVVAVGVGVMVAALILGPLIIKQWENSRVILTNVTNWKLVLGNLNLKNILLIPIKLTSGRISFYPKIVYYLIAGSFATLTWFLVLKKKDNFYRWLIIGTLGMGAVVSVWTPMLQYFRFIYLIPLMAILIGKNKIVAAGFLGFSLIYLLIPKFHREDWKGLVKSLSKDIPVYMVESASDPIKYYNPEIKIINKPEKNMVVIPYLMDIYQIDYKGLVTGAKEYSFRELNYFLLTN